MKPKKNFARPSRGLVCNRRISEIRAERGGDWGVDDEKDLN